jgi:nitrogen fixation NifU-like protein
MFDDLTELYQQVILDHSKRPRNFGKLEHASHTAHGHNPLCGDNIQLSLDVEGGVVKDIRFQGSGCAISTASASLLTESVKGKSKAEIQAIFDRVHELVTHGRQEDGADLGKLAVFAGVFKFPARVKCAILPWHAVVAALADKTGPVSTESEDT